jgi:hypothetical protein
MALDHAFPSHFEGGERCVDMTYSAAICCWAFAQLKIYGESEYYYHYHYLARDSVEECDEMAEILPSCFCQLEYRHHDLTKMELLGFHENDHSHQSDKVVDAGLRAMG